MAAMHPIVFFDGECVLCNSAVDFILRADKDETFLFAPLQGRTAERVLGPLGADPGTWSIMLFDEDGVHDQSDAALRICRRLGGGWQLLSLAKVLPRGLRDTAYRWIARNRYRWFGRHDTCRVPSPSERARFLP
jgi:predicted DCC family thiol-disulfide oxidoreductase YuxK